MKAIKFKVVPGNTAWVLSSFESGEHIGNSRIYKVRVIEVSNTISTGNEYFVKDYVTDTDFNEPIPEDSIFTSEGDALKTFAKLCRNLQKKGIE
jgi:hypothetical protein